MTNPIDKTVEEMAKEIIRNWDGKVYRHLVLHSKKPWHGNDQPDDRTEEIVRSFGHTDFIRLPWASEHEQRSWGLAYLYDCDYVLIVDADELYTEEDQLKILEEIGQVRPFQDNRWCYRVQTVKTYFKDLDHVLDPLDTHEPVVAVDPKRMLFNDKRQPTTQYQIPIEGVIMHHLSYAHKSDRKIWQKVQNFEHAPEIRKDWFRDVWQAWTPDMDDVFPYGGAKRKAVPGSLPEELRRLL